MDAKNDDSAGSDSLDKSLQRKCVVDDVGQGEGVAAIAVAAQNTSDDNEKNKESNSATESRPANSKKKQKTEKSAGDGVGGGVVGGGGNKNKYRNSGAGLDGSTKCSIIETNKTKTIAAECDDVTIKICTSETVCNDTEDSTTKYTPNNVTDSDSTCPTNDAALSGSGSDGSSSSSSNNSGACGSSTNAFETKVKQISKNLKETTLAETANKKASLEESNSTSSASSSSSSSSCSASPECERPTINRHEDVDAFFMQPSTSQAAAAAAAALESSSKKVRFHPDVKENDGGNRVIPKKKKKLKASSASSSGATGGPDDAATAGQCAGGAEDEMELDEEEVIESEGFDLAKTISDAQDYLKSHPLTFVRPYDKSSGSAQSGLLEEEDLPQLSESSEEEDEDFYGDVPVENGVERILGKQIKGGKVEFLLRYAERPGLFWESEEFLTIHCPSLLNQYEQCRHKRLEHLMSQVAKRQNIRQRYTDF